MIELPMSGFAGRGELKEKLTGYVSADLKNQALVVNIYGEDGIGKSTLIAAILKDINKNAFIVDINLNKSHLRFPENALYAIRQEIGPQFADHFALFDLLYLMRVERINGRIPLPPAEFFRHNSAALSKVFEKYRSETYFSRNFYKAVEEGVLNEWFNKHARKSVLRMFQAHNQLNWESLINAFAQGLNEYHDATGKDMVIIVDNADDIFEVDDSGNSWAVSLADKAQCGKFIYLSGTKLSPMKTGLQTDSILMENFTEEDAAGYFDSIGITREAVRETVFSNTGGNPGLMSYCIETSDMMTELQQGHEPMPDIYQADPESIVHLHMSTMSAEMGTFAKTLSALRVFDEELFEAVRKEYVSSTDKRSLPVKVFTDLRFVELVGGGFFAIQRIYKNEAAKALDPDTLENIHYLAFQHHSAKMNSADDYLNFPLHLYEAVHHARFALDAEGFLNWFKTVEKEHLSPEFFNMWLGIYEIASEHISGMLGATHPDSTALSDNLSYLYVKAGRAVNAEETMQKSIDAYVDQFGKNTAETVPQINKLSLIYLQTGDFEAAESILINGLTIREAALGKDHPDVADSLMRLSNLYMQLGKKGEALELAERASAIVNAAKDVSDEKSIETDEAMADVYSKTKNMPKAVQIYKRVTTLKKEKFGEYDIETVKSMGSYAEAVLKNGQPAKAVKLYEDYFEKTVKVFGEQSKAAASAVNDLAVAYQKNKEYSKAEEMHKRALELKDKIYGDNHPSTATSHSNYAQLKYLTGNLSDAELSYKKAAKVYETVLGRVHQKTALGFNNLGFLTSRMGHFEKAEKYYLDALDSKKSLGDERSASFASTLNNLGELMYRMGRKDEAKQYLSKALDIYKDILGDEHPTTQTIAKNLATVSR